MRQGDELESNHDIIQTDQVIFSSLNLLQNPGTSFELSLSPSHVLVREVRGRDFFGDGALHANRDSEKYSHVIPVTECVHVSMIQH
jgi:hypothetical protein